MKKFLLPHLSTALVALIVSTAVVVVSRYVPMSELHVGYVRADLVSAKTMEARENPSGPTIYINPDSLCLYPGNGDTGYGSICLKNEKTGPSVRVMGGEGEETAIVDLRADSSGPRVELAQKSYLLRPGEIPAALVLGAVELERSMPDGQVIKVRRPAPSLVMFGKDGKVAWEAMPGAPAVPARTPDPAR